jgi:glycosyltransferase involved in cell wall biosynthesis
MLYIGIPVYNEAPTIGVVLWQIRAAFQAFAREYEIVVYDDASTDATADVLRPYTDVLPLTVRRGDAHLGYGRALEAVCRTVTQRSRHARRDALITMQGDFTDPPAQLPELIKRFEGGADVVVVERPAAQLAGLPPEVRRLRRVAPWVLRRFGRVAGIADPFGSFRLYRISVLREALKRLEPDAALITHTGWTANVEILRRAAGVARRIETIELPQRYDLRPRPSRVRPFADALSLYRYGRSTRGEERLAAARVARS